MSEFDRLNKLDKEMNSTSLNLSILIFALLLVTTCLLGIVLLYVLYAKNLSLV
jgi:hypothetical protein